MALDKELEQEYRELFNQYDKDGNGFITVEDLKQIQSYAGKSDPILAEYIRDFDVNGDNKITFEEFAGLY